MAVNEVNMQGQLPLGSSTSCEHSPKALSTLPKAHTTRTHTHAGDEDESGEPAPRGDVPRRPGPGGSLVLRRHPGVQSPQGRQRARDQVPALERRGHIHGHGRRRPGEQGVEPRGALRARLLLPPGPRLLPLPRDAHGALRTRGPRRAVDGRREPLPLRPAGHAQHPVHLHPQRRHEAPARPHPARQPDDRRRRAGLPPQPPESARRGAGPAPAAMPSAQLSSSDRLYAAHQQALGKIKQRRPGSDRKGLDCSRRRHSISRACRRAVPRRPPPDGAGRLLRYDHAARAAQVRSRARCA